MSIKQLQSSTIRIEPSKRFYHYISKIDQKTASIPEGILAICEHRKPRKDVLVTKINTLIVNSEDKKYIKSLNLAKNNPDECAEESKETSEKTTKTQLKHALTVSDVRWLHDYIVNINKISETKVYLHELFEGSEVFLPENEEHSRDAELEKRCCKLRAQQENILYNAMTKHIDAVRKRHPEDSIAYQVREMDKYLIVVFQFLMSVAAGFAFGFLGVPLLVYGTMEFGFRLLLGIICALIIAIAELYFVLRKMDREGKMEEELKEKAKKVQ